jgi:MYXO-CTERM domain-containing protein
MGTSWLRQLDDDAASGVLWRRPVLYVPLYLVTGALLGAALGCAGGFALALIRPSTSVITGPDGTPIRVANDDTAVPIISGLVGAVLGLVAVGMLAARRWRRSG